MSNPDTNVEALQLKVAELERVLNHFRQSFAEEAKAVDAAELRLSEMHTVARALIDAVTKYHKREIFIEDVAAYAKLLNELMVTAVRDGQVDPKRITDTKRLTVAQSNKWDLLTISGRWFVRRAFGSYGEGSTVREAIDDAIARTPTDKLVVEGGIQ